MSLREIAPWLAETADFWDGAQQSVSDAVTQLQGIPIEDELGAAIDAGLTVGDALIEAGLSGAGGLATGINSMLGGGEFLNPAVQRMRQIQDAYDVRMPVGEGGERVLSALESVTAPLNQPFEAGAEKTFTGLQDTPFEPAAPTLATGVLMIPEFLDRLKFPSSSGRASQRLSEQLASGAITPEQYTREMQSRGLLTEEEVAEMPKKRPQAVAETIAKTPGMNARELAAATIAGWPKLGWYRNSANALVDVFGVEDSKRFAYLLSALSPQTSVESNLRNAVNVWSNWVEAGRPTGRDEILDIMSQSVEGSRGRESVLDAWVNNSLRALQTEDVHDIRFSGPKVESFARNLTGQLGEVTNDAWMAKAMDVEQDIFKGKPQAGAEDEIGALAKKPAGYAAANAVTREAAQLVEQALREQGVQVNPAEVQETVWSLAKSAWEKRDAPGERRSIQEIVGSGSLAADEIADTPSFDVLLAQTPEYRTRLEAVGGDFSNMREHIYPSEGGLPQAPERELQAFLTRLNDRYNRDTRQNVMRRSALSTLQGGEPFFTDPGRLSSPRWMQGERGRAIQPTDPRAELFESIEMPTDKAYLLDTTEGAANLFRERLLAAKESQGARGAAVEAKKLEDYLDTQLYLLDQGRAGFGIQDGDIVSAFKHQGADIRDFADYMLPLSVQEGGRRLDAFATKLPDLYRRGGFKETGRLKFDDEEAPEGWDYEAMRSFNKGRPDVVSMVLDPAAKPSDLNRKGRLHSSYEEMMEAQAEEIERLMELERRGRLVYPNY